jgi:ATP-binding cassette subfamily B (MDR/TAP) protein 1
MQDSKKSFLPISHGVGLCKSQCPSTPDEQEKMSAIPYASAIGSIMYAMLCTRLDIAYALSVARRYQSNPVEAHWVAAKNILKYFRKPKNKFLVYGGRRSLL